MIVRCGNCQVELEVAGPGEFACPSCGTRNAVRGPAATSPLDIGAQPDLGLGPQFPGQQGPPGASGIPGAPSAPPAPEPDLTWVRCPNCKRKFVVGEDIETAPCPACEGQVTVSSALIS